MASVKLILWKHDQKADGRFPIAIRITKDRKTRYVFTGKYVLEKEWDLQNNKVRKSHENSVRLNAFLRKKLSDVEAINDKAEIADEKLSSVQIKKKYNRQRARVSFFQLAAERIRNKNLEGTFSVGQPELSILHNLLEFINLNPVVPTEKVMDAISVRRKERVSKARSGKVTVEDALKEFSNNTRLSFDDIDMAFINRFKSFCTAYLGHKPRTISNQLIFLRTMFNQAIKEGVVDGKLYPFGGDNEIIRIPSSNKVGLTKEEVEKIENLELEKDSSTWHA